MVRTVGRTALAFMAFAWLATAESRWPSEPHQTVFVEHAFGGQPIPKWENGFLIVRDFDALTVHLFGRDGRKLWTAAIEIPQAHRASLRAMAAWPDGSVAVSGGALDDSGAAAGFIAWLTPGGATRKIVRTARFVAWHLSVANDGTLWALGREAVAPQSTTDAPHDILRRYSRDGQFVKSALPRTSFASRAHPASGHTHLATVAGVVGIYCGPTGEWIEVSSTSGVLLD